MENIIELQKMQMEIALNCLKVIESCNNCIQKGISVAYCQQQKELAKIEYNSVIQRLSYTLKRNLQPQVTA